MSLKQNYRDWILQHSSHWYTIEENGDDNLKIVISNGYAEVNFYQFETLTCELKIMDKNDENTFYLHFELKDFEHAVDLFHEMIDTLEKMKDARAIEAMLCCSSGLTTSFFAEKLNETAKMLSLDIHFTADSYTELYHLAADKDVILLAPQIGYLYNEASQILKDKIVIRVPGAIFGTYDAPAMIDLVRQSVNEKKAEKQAEEDKEAENQPISFAGEYGTFMVVSIISSHFREAMMYRIYHECDLLAKDTIIKERYNIADYEDLLDTVLARHPEVEKVFISTPGIIEDGSITLNYVDIIDYKMRDYFEEKYQRPFALCNLHQAMTRGYYEDHKQDCQNMMFYYIPHLGHAGAAGIIMNGKLLTGTHNIAGQIHYMQKAIHYTDPYRDLAKTPEGHAELIAKQMLPIILSCAPEKVIFHDSMITDVDAVSKWITKYLPQSLQPDISIKDSIREDLFWGAIILGMEELRERGKIK
ncbi:MAG: ROK family protein [Erysipelotrichaceae bacterium]|nr:ROK family protein [Erysipelotrichaceae bacterium]